MPLPHVVPSGLDQQGVKDPFKKRIVLLILRERQGEERNVK